MIILPEIKLKNKSVIVDKLEDFGFRDNRYEKLICDNQFLLTLTFIDGRIFSKVADTASGEEYVLHLVENSAGSYVGTVRQEYESALNKFIEDCCEDNIFGGEITKALIEYVREKYGDELEFLWDRLPDAAIWRRKDSRKWYAALLVISERKLGLDSDKPIDIVDLRGDPDELNNLVDGVKYFRGYHMNKKHWLTIRLDGSVALDEICRRLDDSYTRAVK